VTAILIMTHGNFGQALLQSAELMLGKQEACVCLGLEPQQGREDLAAAAEAALKSLGAEVLIIVDMQGGSPWNVGLPLALQPGRELISGASLPMLLEALSARDQMDAKALGAMLKSAAPAMVALAGELAGGRP
jgi:PTS system mannose-specific IIA component